MIFIDFKYILNESNAGKGAQNTLKTKLENGLKSLKEKEQKIQKDEQKISLGIRQLEENPWEAAKINYPLGMLIEGEVRNFTTYGAFIELEDGIDGMIHVSDISWTLPSILLFDEDDINCK